MCPQFKSGPRHHKFPGLVGDRLMAGHWPLEPRIGVRVPVPQPTAGEGTALSGLFLIDMYGAYSSMAERLIVDQEVVGSKPTRRPCTYKGRNVLAQIYCSSHAIQLLMCFCNSNRQADDRFTCQGGGGRLLFTDSIY